MLSQFRRRALCTRRILPVRCFSSSVAANVSATELEAQQTEEDGVVEKREYHWLADVDTVKELRSPELKRLAESLAEAVNSEKEISPQMWDNLAQRCIKHAPSISHWDAIAIMQSFIAAGEIRHDVLSAFVETIPRYMSKLAPQHLLDLLTIYERAELRPRGLFVEIFHNLTRLTQAMYAQEIVDSVQTLARLNLKPPHLLRALALTCVTSDNLRYLHYCSLLGSFAQLEFGDQKFFEKLESSAKKQLELILPEEVFEIYRTLHTLEHSWRPLEETLHQKFHDVAASCTSPHLVEQFHDPFMVFRVLQNKDMIPATFVEGLVLWCGEAVNRAPTRSRKRPFAHDLIDLHEYHEENNLPIPEMLEYAIQKFVDTDGGLEPSRSFTMDIKKPLRYAKYRKYIHREDPTPEFTKEFREAQQVQEVEENDIEEAEEEEGQVMKAQPVERRGPKGIPNPWSVPKSKKLPSPGAWVTEQSKKIPLWRVKGPFGSGRFSHV